MICENCNWDGFMQNGKRHHDPEPCFYLIRIGNLVHKLCFSCIHGWKKNIKMKNDGKCEYPMEFNPVYHAELIQEQLGEPDFVIQCNLTGSKFFAKTSETLLSWT